MKKSSPQMAKLESSVLMQEHLEGLIRDACHYVTYKNHGKEDEVCTMLLRNPMLDVGRLKALHFDKDMCECGNGCQQHERVMLIPAAIKKPGGIFFHNFYDLFIYLFLVYTFFLYS